MSIKNNYPAISPSLYLNFRKANKLDPRISFSRASTGTYVDSEGIVRTAGINEPRFDYENGKCKGLLVEKQTTNAFLNTNTFTGQSTVSNTGGTGQIEWFVVGGGTLTTNSTIAPDGTNTATLAVINTSDGYVCSNAAYAPTSLQGNRICLSVFAKPHPSNTSYSFTLYQGGGGTDYGVTFNLDPNGSSQTLTDGYSIKLSNGWYRLVINRNVTSGGAMILGWDNRTTDKYYIWGAQGENNSIASSYIAATSTTPVTRATDLVTINDLSWFNDTEGTFVVDTSLDTDRRLGFSTTTTLFSVDNGSSQITLNTSKVTVGTGSTLYTLIGNKNAVGYSSAKSIVVTPELPNFENSGFSTSTGLISGINRVTLGWDPFNSNNNLNGCLKSFIYYPTSFDIEQLNTLVRKDLPLVTNANLVTNSMVNQVYTTGITTVTNGDVNGSYQFKGTIDNSGCGNPNSAVFVQLKDDVDWTKMICQFEMTGGASCWSFNGGSGYTEVTPGRSGFIPGGNMERYDESLGDRIFNDVNAYSSNPIYKRQLSACDGNANNAFGWLEKPTVQSFWLYCRRKPKSAGLAGIFHSRSCAGIGYTFTVKNIYIF